MTRARAAAALQWAVFLGVVGFALWEHGEFLRTNRCAEYTRFHDVTRCAKWLPVPGERRGR